MIIVERREADIAALARMEVDPAALADDGASWRGIVVQKPWGSETELHRKGMVSIWRLSLMPGGETSLHCHPQKRTALIVESGHVILETLHGEHPLPAGETAVIEPGAFHRSRSQTGAVVIEVETPPVKNDIVRLDDRYGRKGKAYAAR